MNYLRNIFNKKGVSPVIGVILLVAVTVALVALATVIVFDIGSSASDSSTDAVINVQETSSGINIGVIRNENVGSIRVVYPDGDSEDFDDVSVGSNINVEGDPGDYSIVAIMDDGSEETIRTVSVSDSNGGENGEGNGGVSGPTSEPSASEPTDLSSTFSGMSGSGVCTEEDDDPYVITNDHELQAMNEDLDACYVLGNNIDASETSEWNDGEGFTPIGDWSGGDRDEDEFTGSLDGQVYEVDGLYIYRPEEEYVGLIGYNEGTVENIGLVNADITGDKYVGGLVGENVATVSESYATGDVTGDDIVGGLVGWNEGGTVSESYATGSVNSDINVGGLVGMNSGEVSESYATGEVTGEGNRVGGLVGWNRGDSEVSESYATGSVTGEGFDVGGLVGLNWGEVSESYWDTESEILEDGTDVSEEGVGTNDGTIDNIEGLTTSQMQGVSAETNMDALDFDTIWKTVTGDYPELQWQE